MTLVLLHKGSVKTDECSEPCTIRMADPVVGKK